MAGISKLHLIFAHSVMTPADRFKAENGELPKDTKEAAPDMDLGALMDLCVDGSDIVRVVADGKTVGVINCSGLIRAIQENRG